MTSQDNRDDRIATSALPAAALLAALPFPLCAMDRDLRIVYANAAWRLLLPASDADARGSLLLDRLLEPERSRWAGIAADALAGRAGGEDSVDTHILEALPDGAAEPRSIRVIVTCIQPGDGPPAGLLLTGCDIAHAEMSAQQRQAEEEARLQVARQLAATLNHEINNPLFIISATLEDLLADTSDPAMERMLRASLEAVWKVSEAVKQLSEIRQIVTTAYIAGHPMIDLQKSQEKPV